MTTKRKQILKAIALAVEPTIDDLQAATGMPRNNLADNLKATVQDGLIERVKDEALGLPAYKLTPKGRAWLEQDKDDIANPARTTSQPKPAAGKNTGSKAVGPRVAGGSMIADPLPASNAVAAPPDQPMQAPVDLVSADVMDLMQRNADLDVRLNSAGKSIVEFCEWLAIRAKVRAPMNLHESKHVIEALVKCQPSAKADVAGRLLIDANIALGRSAHDDLIGIPAKISDLKTMLADRQESFSKACSEVRALEDRINVMTCQMEDSAAKLFASNKKAARWIELANHYGCNDVHQFSEFVNNAVNAKTMTKTETFANLKQSDLPAGVTLKNPQQYATPIRYIVADSYTIADCPESANAYALELVNHNGTESSVVVFEANRARELRINWSDV